MQKAKTLLGFEPKYNVMDMLTEIHSHRESLGDLDQDNYYNIRRFKQLNLA